jgi:YggT family protein
MNARDMAVTAVNALVIVLTVIIFARVIVSWIAFGQSGGNNPVVAFIYQISEPILAPIRRIMPKTGVIDLSPMVAMLLLWLIQWLVTTFVR